MNYSIQIASINNLPNKGLRDIGIVVLAKWYLAYVGCIVAVAGYNC